MEKESLAERESTAEQNRETSLGTPLKAWVLLSQATLERWPGTVSQTVLLPLGESGGNNKSYGQASGWHRPSRLADHGLTQPESKFLTDATLLCMNEGPGNAGEEIQAHIHSRVPHPFRKRGKASVIGGRRNALCRLKLPQTCQSLCYSSHMECLV